MANQCHKVLLSIQCILFYSFDLDFSLQIIIRVSDSNVPPRVTDRSIFIDLSDIDDNEPTFVCPGAPRRTVVQASVLENQSNTRVTQVEACDADADGEIFYAIVGRKIQQVLFFTVKGIIEF